MTQDLIQEDYENLCLMVTGACTYSEQEALDMIQNLYAHAVRPTKDAFIRGQSVVAANAVRLETWQPEHILGGVTVQDIINSGAYKDDIETLKKYAERKECLI